MTTWYTSTRGRPTQVMPVIQPKVSSEEPAVMAVMLAPTLVVLGANGVAKYANASNISKYAESVKK